MTEHEASRTLVKSPPELWAECSDAASLTRHLGQFGDIRITRLEPETAVAWEGEHASGTVRLEPSGWGTRVILTARRVAGEAGPAVEAGPPDQDGGRVDPVQPASRARVLGRLLGLFRRAPKASGVQRPAVEPAGSEPAGLEPPRSKAALGSVAAASAALGEDGRSETAPAPAAIDSRAALASALDSLGQAHHRPFSRG